MSSYRQMLTWAGNYLKEGEISDGELDAWYLLEEISGFDRASYFLHSEDEMPKEQEETYREWMGRRHSHVPLQHIIGKAWFMGMEFLVNEHVLIPRQDTEVLVEEAMKELKPGMKVLDMCTGSGCILLSLLAQNREVTGVGADISQKALEVAAKNGCKLEEEDYIGKEQIQWLHTNLFENVKGTFSMLVSNPPYIPTKVIAGLMPEVKEHDPMLALDGKEDGLYFYRKIIAEAGNFLKPGAAVFFEIGYDQAEAVTVLLEEHKFAGIHTRKDLAGLDRVVTARWNG